MPIEIEGDAIPSVSISGSAYPGPDAEDYVGELAPVDVDTRVIEQVSYDGVFEGTTVLWRCAGDRGDIGSDALPTSPRWAWSVGPAVPGARPSGGRGRSRMRAPGPPAVSRARGAVAA